MANIHIVSFGYGHEPAPEAHLTLCTGGRHRAPHFARILVNRLQHDGHTVSIHHRDIDKPVINR